MIGALLLFGALATQSAAEQPEVLSTVGVQEGNVIGEAVVMDQARELTMRHNYRTNSLEDFNTGFVAMKNVKWDGRCAVMRMARGKQAQAEEKEQTRADAGKLKRIRTQMVDAQPVADVAALAGERVAKFCGGGKVVHLVNKARTSKRGFFGSIWSWVKNNVKFGASVSIGK